MIVIARFCVTIPMATLERLLLPMGVCCPISACLGHEGQWRSRFACTIPSVVGNSDCQPNKIYNHWKVSPWSCLQRIFQIGLTRVRRPILSMGTHSLEFWSEKPEKQMSTNMHSLCFLTVDTKWAATSYSGCHDFPDINGPCSPKVMSPNKPLLSCIVFSCILV